MGLVFLAARWVMAAIFLRSGLAKATDLAGFRSAVGNYELVPAGLVTPVSMSLPFAEITAAVLLALGVLPVVIAALLSLLLVAFSVAIAINLARGRVFDCGCAGSAAVPRMISWPHVIVDLVLAAVAAALAIAPPAVAQLWRGPAGLVHVGAPDAGALPVLLAVLVFLAMAALVRRTVAVTRLLPAASVHRGGDPAPIQSRRH
jgi:hypothetical protein